MCVKHGELCIRKNKREGDCVVPRWIKRRNQHVLCLGIVQLHSEVVGLPLSEISVVHVIVERQKMLALMEVLLCRQCGALSLPS